MMEFPQILFVVCPLVFLGGLIDAVAGGNHRPHQHTNVLVESHELAGSNCTFGYQIATI